MKKIVAIIVPLVLIVAAAAAWYIFFRSEPQPAFATVEKPIVWDITPDTVFKEYIWNGPFINEEKYQRVTDPECTWETIIDGERRGAFEHLPNPVNTIIIDDLEGAERIEMYLEIWEGHAGTSEKKFKINDSDWILIPNTAKIERGIPESYQQMRHIAIPVPLELFKTGENTFEFSCGKQITHNFDYPHWGVYGATFRVYYPKEKPHTSARIVNPSRNSGIGEKVTFEIEALSSDAKIRQVDYIGFYEDFDYDGDCEYLDWQYYYRYGIMQRHIGTSRIEPFKVDWNTEWIPDQEEPIVVVARIIDENGMCYITPAITGLELKRDYSVKLYKPYSIPEKWIARTGLNLGCKVDIFDEVEKAIDARVFISLWNGGDEFDSLSLNGKIIAEKLGSSYAPTNHIFSIPVDTIKHGTNMFHTFATTYDHGAEVMLPGIILKVKYE